MEASPFAADQNVVVVAQRILTARDAQVAHYAKLYPLLLAELEEIMADWDKSADKLPWSRLAANVRQNNLSGVITRVIDCAMSSAPRQERVEALIDAACSHGECRRSQGVDVQSLFTEYDHIRTATWQHLKQIAEPPVSYDAIFVIDGLLSVASRGTVLGYHREEMEANGLWSKQRAELKETVRS